MLKLRDIVKNYPTATTTVHALRGVSLSFRESEFVAILGPSGCGKTTMLNLIGGLDRYTSGDLIIGGVSTRDFDDLHWDAYRNQTIGFVFQSYNLIPHLTVLENVELALSLTGQKKKIRRAKAIKALERVNMKDEINKRPNQLSGGQMQRVAIARAIVNDPKIILADEPTGALDSELSVQVMDILKEISETCLVIMVTHNGELARQYCNRICSFRDGQLVSDTNPYSDEGDANGNEMVVELPATPIEQLITTDTLSCQNDEINTKNAQEVANEEYEDDDTVKVKKVSNRKRKKAMKHIDSDKKDTLAGLGIKVQKKRRKDSAFKPTSMSGAMAFGLSMRNLISKFKRTFFTAFAGSIGIIGLALVLSISNGFDVFVENMQTEMLAGVPLGIYQYNINDSAIMDMMLNMAKQEEEGLYPDSDMVGVGNSQSSADFIGEMLSAFFDGVKKNDITNEFATYVQNMPNADKTALSVYYATRFNLVTKGYDRDGNPIYIDSSQVPDPTTALNIATTVLSENGLQTPNWQVAVGDKENMMKSYDFIGENSRYPENKNEILLSITKDNKISQSLLDTFGLNYVLDESGNLVLDEDGNPMPLNEINADYFIGKKIRLVDNNDYYTFSEIDGVYEMPDNFSESKYNWTYEDQSKLEDMYNKGEELEIVGVIRQKQEGTQYVGSALIYTPELAEYVREKAYNSEVAIFQRTLYELGDTSGYTIFGTRLQDKEVTNYNSIVGAMTTGLFFKSYLKAIGADNTPSYINIYPGDYAGKEAVSAYIADWNTQNPTNEIGFFDVSAMFIVNLQMIIDLVSVMLIAVASIALVVSTVMIGVITSNSVIERTREIGILRSLGARKMDIRHVFIAETSIIGLFSGLMGILVTYIFCPIISAIIEAVVGVPSLLHFHPLHALLLVVLSLVLTVISGIIPAVGASRKNVVDALRVE